MRKSLLSLVLVVLIQLSFGQNRYISFQDGFTTKQNQQTLPSRSVVTNKAVSVEMSYQFFGAFVADVNVKETQYQFLHMDGMHKMALVGAPALPAKNEIVAVPKGAKPVVKIIRADYKDYGGFYIHPALEPARDTEGAPAPEFEIDEAIYSTNAFFPSQIVEIVNVGVNRGTGLAFAEIRPVQFNPVTKTIRVYTNIEFEITFEGGAKSFGYAANENTRRFTNLLKRRVINSDAIPGGMENRASISKSEAKNYIVITHSAYSEQAEALANWKRQLGYSVEVVAQDSWTSDEVKSAIATRYQNWTPKPDYFVIIGDHTGSYAVPGEVVTESGGESFATDLYYACMDGASDWHPDMARGRISVSSPAEATVVINKIINYEQNPPTQASFYENGLACAQFQDKVDDEDTPDGYAARRFCHTSEEIRDYMIGSQGYTVGRVYYTDAENTPTNYNNTYYSNGQAIPDELLRANGFDWNGGASDITSAINAGKFYIFHRDHGYVGGSGWAHPYYTTTSMNSLSNGENLPVVFSMNCHTGEYQLDNCFAEKFLRMENKGAVGVVAAAYYSLSGYNDALAVGLIDAIWADPGLYPVMGSAGSGNNYTIGTENSVYTMGDALVQGLFAMEQNVSWLSDRQYEYELFHWFGDPAMRIWTANPNDNIIAATHATDISCDGTTFSISGSEPDAIVTLVFNNQLIGTAVVDASGNADIEYAMSEMGTEATLTVSAHNHKPYTATLVVTGTCSFPPQMATNSVTAIGENGATLNGTIVHDSDAAISESGFVYNTTGNPEIGGSGVVQVQTNPVVASGDFSIDIDNLTASTKYYVRAYATNANGTSYGAPVSFTTLCGVFTSLPFTTDFAEGLAMCWENIDNQGGGAVWQFNNPGGRNFQSTTAANGFAILDSDTYGSGSTQDADLVTAVLDLSAYTSVNLKFEHYYYHYSSSTASLLYSIDGGSVWNVIETWSADEGSLETPAVFDEDVSAYVAGQSNVMLKWKYTGSYGWYWAIDDIALTNNNVVAYAIDFSVTSMADAQPIANAEIAINNSTLTTDVDGLASIELEDGNYPYTVDVAGYVSHESTLNVSGVGQQVSVELQPLYLVTFIVNLDGQPVADAMVEIDGEQVVTGLDGIAAFELIDGEYVYTCSLDGYDDVSGTVTVAGSDISPVISFTEIGETVSHDVNIYPNPSSGTFTVDLPGVYTVSVISESGALIYSKSHTKQQPVELGNVAQGIYVLKIETQHSTFVKQMVINQ